MVYIPTLHTSQPNVGKYTINGSNRTLGYNDPCFPEGTLPKSNIDTKNDGFLKSISFQTWSFFNIHFITVVESNNWYCMVYI